jgi:hypothetical protein
MQKLKIVKFLLFFWLWIGSNISSGVYTVSEDSVVATAKQIETEPRKVVTVEKDADSKDRKVTINVTKVKENLVDTSAKTVNLIKDSAQKVKKFSEKVMKRADELRKEKQKK